MPRFVRWLVPVFGAALLGGACTDRGVVAPPGNESVSLAARLADKPTLYFDPITSQISISARYLSNPVVVGRATIPLLQGSMDVSLDTRGNLVVESFAADLDDVIAKPTDVPIHLTGIHVSLENPFTAETAWSFDQGEAQIDTTMYLVLDWALVGADGKAYPLGAQKLGPIAVFLDVTTDRGHVVATVAAANHGVLWDWAGLVQLTDLRMELDAFDYPMGPIP